MLRSSEHTAPLKVAKTFQAQSGELLVYLMDASAGLFGGDTQSIECHVGPGASLYVTSQAACKLHPAAGDAPSLLTQRMFVAENATLEYFPEPMIPLTDSHHEGDMKVWLSSRAQAFIGEIITAGRVGRGEFFKYRRFANRMSVYWNSELSVYDPLELRPSEWIGSAAVFEGFTHIGTLWALSDRIGAGELQLLQELLSSPRWNVRLYGGCSQLQRGGVVLRALGKSAWELQEVLYEAWSLLRSQALGKPLLKIRK